MDKRCVKGVNFREFREVGFPAPAAAIYNAQGADELLLVDITARMEKRTIPLDVVQETANECFMPLTVGGGLRTLSDARGLFLAGADKVLVSAANDALITAIADDSGSASIVASIDYRDDPTRWAVEMEDAGAGEILLTNIDREGTRTGYDLENIQRVSEAVGIPVIASGGAGNPQHMVEAVEAGASAVAAGTLFHFTDQSVIKVRYAMRNAGLDVRL